jgi:hypothetical protein
VLIVADIGPPYLIWRGIGGLLRDELSDTANQAKTIRAYHSATVRVRPARSTMSEMDTAFPLPASYARPTSLVEYAPPTKTPPHNI